MSFLFLYYCLFVFEGFQSNIIITLAFWYTSFIEQRYWSCCITRWCGLGLGHYNAVWIHWPKAVCGEILMVWFNTATRCKNAETCHFYFKALLVIHLWDIIITSALPSIPSCSCKFWACPCIAGNFDKGRRSWTGHLSPTKVHFVNIFATGWSVTVQCFFREEHGMDRGYAKLVVWYLLPLLPWIHFD